MAEIHAARLPATWVLLFVFGISGAAGLIYEVVWFRQFSLALGASSYAITTVLVAFMSGLGLGAWVLGRWADRFGPRTLALAYIGLEAAIGAYALALPSLMRASEVAYVDLCRFLGPGPWLLNGIRLALAFILMILPTTLMGASLPVLSRLVVRGGAGIPDVMARLYGSNTLGAVLGTVLAGYVLLPSLGLRFSTHLAVGLNFLSAAAVLGWVRFVARFEKVSPLAGPTESTTDTILRPSMSPTQKAATWAYALSGTAAMVYEVAWTRTLSMILGNTTYAFTTMLATFLLGLVVGSLTYPRVKRYASPIVLLIVLQLVATLSVLATIPIFGRLPLLYLSLRADWVSSWADLQYLRFALASLVMFLPTVCLGMTFPVIGDILVDQEGTLGRRIGLAYGLNTLGGVFGTVGAGLILIPWLGLQTTIVVGASINLIAGLVATVRLPEGSARKRFRVLVAAATAALVLTLCGRWSPQVMNSGVYMYASRYEDLREEFRKLPGGPRWSSWEIWRQAMLQYQVLSYGSDSAVTVAVMEGKDGIRFLTVDGKTDAGTGPKDMRTQVMLAQLPLLFHPDPRRVLVVGLGSGITTGSVLTHEVETVDCAEISSAVIEASAFFVDFNHHALADPRLDLIQRDARNWLRTSTREYDVIVSEPSNPWISGQAALFSQEWYRLVDARLGAGGLFVQWLPVYGLDARDIDTVARTLRSVFPHVTLWNTGAVGDVILLARKGGPLTVNYPAFARRATTGKVAGDLARLGFDPEILPVALFLMSEQDLVEHLETSAAELLNTDDHPSIEFTTPKRMGVGKDMSPWEKSRSPHGRFERFRETVTGLDRDAFERLCRKLEDGKSSL